MKQFYKILCMVCAVLAVICVPFRPLWFGLAFFTTLCGCSLVMYLLFESKEKYHNKWGTVAKWLIRVGNTIFVLWLISVAIVEGFILSGAHTDKHAMQTDTIFVLGGGIIDDQPTETLRSRLAVALDVMQQNPDAQVIVCGGQGADEDYTESFVMWQWMVQHGGDAKRITQESQSRNTMENIENALQICEENGWNTQNVSVVSSGFHLYRTRHIMSYYDLNPAVIAAPSGGNIAMRALFCLREYFSIVKVIFSGYW